MDFGRGMRSKHYPVLFGELGDAQRAGEAGAARGIELNVTYAALHDEIAHGKTRQFALAMRQRDRGRRRQSGEIGRLQIPMQRLFEPEDPIRFDGTGEFDAVGQIVGRVHIQHQERFIANGASHSADALGFRRNGTGAGLELYRVIAKLDELRQFGTVIGVGCSRSIIPPGRIREYRPDLAPCSR